MLHFDPLTPYNHLPNIPPQADIETKPILKACIEARSALAELKGAGALIPNQTVLINTIPLLEAKASSEIENIVTTTDALFRHALDDSSSADPATKEALRYRTALFVGLQSLNEKPLSTWTAIKVCSLIKGIEMDIRKVTGTALAGDKSGEIIYTPPTGVETIRSKLNNWESFIHNRLDIDPVIRMAITHYQFEAIHPFTDGNGRTGRVINLLFLISEGLLDQPILYLSRYILRHKLEYYRLLLEVTTEARWEPWILFILKGVTETALSTSAKIRAIRMLIEETTADVRTKLPKVYSRELIDAIFLQPYCRISVLISAGIAKREAASNYLRSLSTLGILAERKVGREKIFIHPKFMDLLLAQ
jgi:Fic family protein